jgi:hypothetical protein
VRAFPLLGYINEQLTIVDDNFFIMGEPQGLLHAEMSRLPPGIGLM